MSDGEIRLAERAALPQQVGDIIHEPAETVRIGKLAAGGIRRVLRPLRHYQDGIASASNELINEAVALEHVADIILPSMKMDHKVHTACFPETARNEHGYGVVGIMLRRAVGLSLIGVALGARGMRKGRRSQVKHQRFAQTCIVGFLAPGCTAATKSGDEESKSHRQSM